MNSSSFGRDGCLDQACDSPNIYQEYLEWKGLSIKVKTTLGLTTETLGVPVSDFIGWRLLAATRGSIADAAKSGFFRDRIATHFSC